MKKIEEIIEEKKKFIEDKTEDKVTLEINESADFGAYIDFPNWDRKGLPKILYKSSVDKIHLLHEFIHLEKFFIEQHSIICHRDKQFTSIDKIFKNIPEDYVAHKIIKDKYGFHPVDNNWFIKAFIVEEIGTVSPDNLDIFDSNQTAANLVNWWAFSEFCPKHRKKFDKVLLDEAKKKKKLAWLKTISTIDVLKKMNYRDKDNYNQCVGEITKIFVPEHYENKNIIPKYLSKEDGEWTFKDLDF